jgi:hypothetical protein
LFGIVLSGFILSSIFEVSKLVGKICFPRLGSSSLVFPGGIGGNFSERRTFVNRTLTHIIEDASDETNSNFDGLKLSMKNQPSTKNTFISCRDSFISVVMAIGFVFLAGWLFRVYLHPGFGFLQVWYFFWVSFCGIGLGDFEPFNKANLEVMPVLLVGMSLFILMFVGMQSSALIFESTMLVNVPETNQNSTSASPFQIRSLENMTANHADISAETNKGNPSKATFELSEDFNAKFSSSLFTMSGGPKLNGNGKLNNSNDPSPYLFDGETTTDL